MGVPLRMQRGKIVDNWQKSVDNPRGLWRSRSIVRNMDPEYGGWCILSHNCGLSLIWVEVALFFRKIHPQTFNSLESVASLWVADGGYNQPRLGQFRPFPHFHRLYYDYEDS
jgi:hypothetical protein